LTSPAFSDTIYSCTFIRKTNEEAGKVIAQILAVVIFIAMFVLIVLEVWERHVITLGCGLLHWRLVLRFVFLCSSTKARLSRSTPVTVATSVV
jgi:hypothetical protein